MWTEELLQLLGKEITPSRDDIQAAYKLKNANLPQKIYKFRAIKENSLDNLKNDTVWICSADKYNDPYDCTLTFSFESLFSSIIHNNFDWWLEISNIKGYLEDEEIEEIRVAPVPLKKFESFLLKKMSDSNERSREVLDSMTQLAQTNLVEGNKNFLHQRIKVCSFSSRNDSVVMWGHYADSHKGFCLEYDVTTLNEGKRNVLYPVIYSNELFDATKFFAPLPLEEEKRRNYSLPDLAAIHKSPDWSYEDEWRFVINSGRDFEDCNISMPKPSAIYLGSKISEDKEKEQAVASIADEKGIPIYKMHLSTTGFKLEPHLYLQ